MINDGFRAVREFIQLLVCRLRLSTHVGLDSSLCKRQIVELVPASAGDPLNNTEKYSLCRRDEQHPLREENADVVSAKSIEKIAG